MKPVPRFVEELIGQLRRRGLQIGVDDYLDLQRALTAGYGLASDDSFRRLCVALWAKSPADIGIVEAACARVEVPRWLAQPVHETADDSTPPAGDGDFSDPADPGRPTPAADGGRPAVHDVSGLVHPPPRTGRRDVRLVLTPQYPLTDREIVQAWRTLRRPTRQGPPVELDVEATLRRRAVSGVRTPPALVAARRNTTRVLMLVDRQGSMAPFHDYVDHIRSSMERAGRFDTFTVVYFHNTAGRSHDQAALHSLPDPFSPALDPILADIGPLTDGWVYRDPDLTEPLGLDAVLATVTRTTSTVVISDAGAARGALNSPRLLDTVALGKALRAATGGLAWLNPAGRDRWARSTAGQLARHLPMFPLERAGMYRAVDVLRGRPTRLERPL
jgi:hypothetical protein